MTNTLISVGPNDQIIRSEATLNGTRVFLLRPFFEASKGVGLLGSGPAYRLNRQISIGSYRLWAFLTLYCPLIDLLPSNSPVVETAMIDGRART